MQTKKAYDIDIVDLYFSLKRFTEKNEIPNSKEALEGFWWSIYYYCEANGIDFKKEFHLGKFIIIQPNSYNYPQFISRYLAYMDIAKINLFLNYQKTIFNPDSFKVDSLATLVEHTVYRQITWMSLYRTDDRLEKITKWIEDDQKHIDGGGKEKKMRREFVDDTNDNNVALEVTKLQIEQTPVVEKKHSIKKDKDIAPSFTLIGYEKNIDYFVMNASKIMKFFFGLKKGGFIPKDTPLDNFKNIFSSKNIKPQNRINWTRSFIDLQMMISMLMGDLKKIKEIEYKWETAVKSFVKDGKSMKATQLSKARGKKTNENKLRIILQNL